MIDWKSTIGQGLINANDPNSHVELQPNVFHPSQIASCRRQCYLSKLGLKQHSIETLGAFQTGTLIHSWLEENVQELLPSAVFEVPISFEDAGIVWKGHTDCWDTENGILYDFKTTGAHQCSNDNFYYVEEEGNEAHIDQLTIYMRSLEITKAKVIYLCKKNPTHIREWPKDKPFSLDMERYNALNRKAREIAKTIEQKGIAESEEEIPFEKCGCWLCESEELAI